MLFGLLPGPKETPPPITIVVVGLILAFAFANASFIAAGVLGFGWTIYLIVAALTVLIYRGIILPVLWAHAIAIPVDVAIYFAYRYIRRRRYRRYERDEEPRRYRGWRH